MNKENDYRFFDVTVLVRQDRKTGEIKMDDAIRHIREEIECTLRIERMKENEELARRKFGGQRGVNRKMRQIAKEFGWQTALSQLTTGEILRDENL